MESLVLFGSEALRAEHGWVLLLHSAGDDS